MACVQVTVVAVKGSAPREPGASMTVLASSTTGTIGGGRLEQQAVEQARTMLIEVAGDGQRYTWLQRQSLNPDFDQCCGGVVDLLFEVLTEKQLQHRQRSEQAYAVVRFAGYAELNSSIEYRVFSEKVEPAMGGADQFEAQVIAQAQDLLPDNHVQSGCILVKPEASDDDRYGVISLTKPSDFNISLFGAGHVGKAIVDILSRLDCKVRWIDNRESAFPNPLPDHIECIYSRFPAAEVTAVPRGGYVMVMTHSHELDFEICDHVLARDDVRFLGLIGSEAKARQFRKQFTKRGLDASEIDRLTCPIGIADIRSKQPAAIAVSVVAQLLALHSENHSQNKNMQALPTLANLNNLSKTEFVDTLAGIFEHSPWVAESVTPQRPFADLSELHTAMVEAVQAAQPEQQMALLRAHPELAGREAQQGGLTESSTSEQASAQLDALSADEMSRMKLLNRDYQAKFGFPFIIAVRNHSKTSIFAEFECRIKNDVEAEQATALQQVAEIARIRLDALLGIR